MSVSLRTLDPNIALIEIDRPRVRNALNWRGMDQFAALIEKAHALPDLRALIVAGRGQAFCSGGDLKELAGYGSADDGWRLSRVMSGALKRLENLPCPTIAAMNGPARGGGAELALACDLRVMAENADLGMMHINIGIAPAWGGGQRLLRMVGYSRALEWLTTGYVLSAEEALAHGLANRLAPVGEALGIALDMARQIAARPPSAVQAIKRFLRAGLALSASAAARLEQAEFPRLWAAEEHHKLVQKFFDRKRR